jgi:membrane protein implicated in regulation of membrane protease activity
MPRKLQPEVAALVASVLAVVACVIGLAVSLDAPPWVAWGLGLVLSAVVSVNLARRALDERTLRREATKTVERTTPEPPFRPNTPQL